MVENDSPASFRAGDVVGGRYRIESRLGEGGMGRVYLAEDLRLKGQRWALKIVPPDAADPAQAEKEAEIMTALRHPSLPRIVDYFFETGAGCCIAMDYLEGETLLQRSAAHEHALPWTTVVHYGAQLCDLLDYLHSLDSPVVFRDVKPSNVIVGKDDSVRLIDFGIARTYKEGKASDTVHVGSVGFAAPELLANRQTDHRADLYSLGSMLYFLLSGGQFYNFTKQPLAETSPGLPPWLSSAVSRLLEKDPSLRFSDAKAAKAALTDAAPPAETRGGGGGGSGSRQGQRTIVGVFGLFPHAGATFVAAALAERLAARGFATTYTSFPWADADAYLYMLHAAKSVDGPWRERGVDWHLPPRQDMTDGAFDAAPLYKLLFETRGDMAVFDVPASAHPSASEALLRACDIAVAVAAPEPGSLRSRLAVDNWRRLQACAGAERAAWIANRMPAAWKAPEFYSLFAAPPVCVVPAIPYDRVTMAKWSGKLVAADAESARELDAALAPLLHRLAPARSRGTGIAAAAKKWLANKWPVDYNK